MTAKPLPNLATTFTTFQCSEQEQTPSPVLNVKGCNMKKLLIVVNVDWFLVSHRLDIALQAKNSEFEVHILTKFTEYKDFLNSKGFITHDLEVDRSSTSVISIANFLYDLVKQFRKIKPDIVHLITIKPVLIGGIAARMTNVPAVVSAISGLGTVFIDSNTVNFRLQAVKQLYKQALTHKNINVIFQNTDDLNTIQKLTGLKDSNIALIKGSGVNLDEFQYTQMPQGEPIVMFASRLLKDKGIIEFIEAIKQIKNNKPNIPAKFVLVGMIDEENQTSIKQAELDEWIQNDLVEYWGYQSNMAEVLGKSSIVVLPSYREGFPKVLLEAAAIGRPIITTEVPGCKDAIIDQQTGLLVPLKNSKALSAAILRLLENMEEAEKMGKQGRILAEKEYSIDNVVAEHMSIYRKLLKG